MLRNKRSLLTNYMKNTRHETARIDHSDTKTQINRLQAVIGHETDQNKEEASHTLYGTLNLDDHPGKTATGSR
ncbi:hypothetical protein I8F73_03490 [Enterococcus faecalis]|nr:hypothetical protein [Enterococcus faecalis]